MKKIIIGACAIGMCFVLTACGTSKNDATLTRLGNQLDETANTISNIQTINPTEITLTADSLEKISAKESPYPLYRNIRTAQESLQTEEQIKSIILNKTTNIKSNLSKNLTLSKSQISAIKELTENLGKYTNSISYSKNDLQSTAKAINSLKKNVEKFSPQLNAKINRLTCNSNARSAYYENLLATLNEIENCVYPYGYDNQMALYKEQNTQNQFNTSQNTTNDTNESENKQGIKNIDTYQQTTNNYTNCNDCDDKNCENCTNQPQQPQYYNQYATPYGLRNHYPYNYSAITPYSQFNPNRNTDTYGPTLRNIDTYGNNYAYNGINNYPVYNNAYNNFMFNKRYYPNQQFGHFYTSNDINRLAYENVPPMTTYVNSSADNLEPSINENQEKTEENTTIQDNLANTPKTLEYIAERDDKNTIIEHNDPISNAYTEQTTTHSANTEILETSATFKPIIDNSTNNNSKENNIIEKSSATNQLKSVSNPKVYIENNNNEEPTEIIAHNPESVLSATFPDINNKIPKPAKQVG